MRAWRLTTLILGSLAREHALCFRTFRCKIIMVWEVMDRERDTTRANTVMERLTTVLNVPRSDIGIKQSNHINVGGVLLTDVLGSLLDKIELLEQRVAELEAPGGPGQGRGRNVSS